MSDSNPPYMLAEVESAAQPLRYGLLGLYSLGWFRARPAANRLGVQRGTVRAQADVLVDLGFAERRELTDFPKQTFEWRITSRGADLYARLAALLDEPAPARVVVEEAAPAALIAVAGTVAPDDLPATLADLAARGRPIAGYWVASPVGPNNVSNAR